ncbi:MAG: hypothetical protein DRG78_03710 [Epsilonproteobacteria bacterium]|nr:MAG: hypothetical protein DRG78_03710 [Campylobacterota bacterium]
MNDEDFTYTVKLDTFFKFEQLSDNYLKMLLISFGDNFTGSTKETLDELKVYSETAQLIRMLRLRIRYNPGSMFSNIFKVNTTGFSLSRVELNNHISVMTNIELNQFMKDSKI